EVLAEIAHPAGLQTIDRGLDPREVFLPDRHAGRLEDMAVSLLALAQAAKDRQTRQRIREPPADLLEHTLLLRRPYPRIRALAETEHVRLIALRVESHDDPGLDAQALRHLGRQRMRRARPESHGTARRPHDSEHAGRLRVHGQLDAHAEEARIFRASTLHLHPVREGLRV